ncbi:hypothetical protein NMG60_11033494 [Bertholletia excelsa]
MSEPFDVIDFVVNKGNGAKGLSDLGLQSVLDHYIQPPEERIDGSKVLADESVPIIDLSNWESDDPNLAESIREAAREWGFFQIVNHGIPTEVLENATMAGHRFFSLPAEDRRNYFLKETSDSTTVRLRTSFIPQEEKLLEWIDFLSHVYSDDSKASESWASVSKDQILEYMKCYYRDSNAKEIDETKENMLMGTLMVNFNYCAMRPNPDITAGLRPDADVSSISILLQDDSGGLYVRAKDVKNCMSVKPVKGALVVNVGDVLQIVSNDRYESIEHRVSPSASKNKISVPVFANPKSDVLFGPLPEALQPGEKPICKEVLYGDYFAYYFSKAHDGKHTIEYICLRTDNGEDPCQGPNPDPDWH